MFCAHPLAVCCFVPVVQRMRPPQPLAQASPPHAPHSLHSPPPRIAPVSPPHLVQACPQNKAIVPRLCQCNHRKTKCSLLFTERPPPASTPLPLPRTPLLVSTSTSLPTPTTRPTTQLPTMTGFALATTGTTSTTALKCLLHCVLCKCSLAYDCWRVCAVMM